MSISQPSQYDVDNMEPGDMIYVTPRSSLYKWYRKLFKKDLLKLRVKRDIEKYTAGYDEYYQEDCTLIYAYENSCIQKYEDDVLVGVTHIKKKSKITTIKLKVLQISLYNVTMTLPDGTTYILPLDYIENAMQKNQMILKQCDKQKLIKDALKFQKYKGDYFYNYSREHNIKVWNSSYCSICGKPIKMYFKKDKVEIKNMCECGFNKLDLPEMSYDEFANWYAAQTDKIVKDRFKEFWFKKE